MRTVMRWEDGFFSSKYIIMESDCSIGNYRRIDFISKCIETENQMGSGEFDADYFELEFLGFLVDCKKTSLFAKSF